MPLGQNEGPIGMVICPSRELATQTNEITDIYCKVRYGTAPPVPRPTARYRPSCVAPPLPSPAPLPRDHLHYPPPVSPPPPSPRPIF